MRYKRRCLESGPEPNSFGRERTDATEVAEESADDVTTERGARAARRGAGEAPAAPGAANGVRDGEATKEKGTTAVEAFDALDTAGV